MIQRPGGIGSFRVLERERGKKMRKGFKATLATILSVAMLSGCGSSTSSAASTASAASGDEKLADEQVLNLSYTDLDLLDVNDIRNANEFQVLSEVQEGLFRTFTDDNGIETVENAGCTSYDVSDDQLTYTFHLRKESMWSDGQPVTAQNYVDSWLRLLNPDNAFAYAFLAYGIQGAEDYAENGGSIDNVAIKKIDDLTFSATLAQPDPAFIKKVSMCCFFPVRKDLIDAAQASGGNWTNDYKLHVFNGPFVISDRVLQNSMTLTKNDKYWDKDNVKLTQVNLQVVSETTTQAQLMESQQLDVLQLTDLEYVDKWQSLVDDGTLVHKSLDAPSITYLVFDQHPEGNGGPSGLMLNEKCRKAISLALDRQDYVDLFEESLSKPAYGLIPYGITVGDTEFRAANPEPLKSDEDTALASDPAKLKALFEEGAKEAGHSGNAADETLTVFAYTPSTKDNNILEWYKQELESKLGCTVKIDIYPDVSTWKTARNSYQYDFYTMGWFGDYNDPMTFMELFTTGNGYAKFMGGFSDSEYDSLIQKAGVSQDQKERLDLFAQAEKILIDKGGVCPLYFPQEQHYVQSYVKGLSILTFGAKYEFSHAYILAH